MGARARSHRVSIVFEVIRDFGCDHDACLPSENKKSRMSR